MEYGRVHVNVSEGTTNLRPHASRTRKRRKNRRRRNTIIKIMIAALVLIAAIVLIVLISGKKTDNTAEAAIETAETAEKTEASQNQETETESVTEAEMIEAETLPMETELVENTNIPHLFFHSFIVDTDRAFDGDERAGGYNQLMVTCDEFNKICQQLYDRGYMLVSLHDIAHEEEDPETGKMKMVWGEIRLPVGKKPVVFSQDDPCYYERQISDGLAWRMVVGEDGRPACEYKDTDGNISVGAYDLVPLLDAFIDEHPDFSYNGAKASLALTGYNGILGYRTDDSYDPASPDYDSSLYFAPNNNIDADRAEAVKVLKALADDGYELASHSWGHLNMGNISWERFKRDCDRWDKNVNSLIREATGKGCDILIYPLGADIGCWKGYQEDVIDDEGDLVDAYKKYCYLDDLGFKYFCNVDATQNFVQKGGDYLRQGRRNVDGDRMWRDMQDPEKAKLKDFFDVEEVFDSRRPTPVPSY